MGKLVGIRTNSYLVWRSSSKGGEEYEKKKESFDLSYDVAIMH